MQKCSYTVFSFYFVRQKFHGFCWSSEHIQCQRIKSPKVLDTIVDDEIYKYLHVCQLKCAIKKTTKFHANKLNDSTVKANNKRFWLKLDVSLIDLFVSIYKKTSIGDIYRIIFQYVDTLGCITLSCMCDPVESNQFYNGNNCPSRPRNTIPKVY